MQRSQNETVMEAISGVKISFNLPRSCLLEKDLGDRRLIPCDFEGPTVSCFSVNIRILFLISVGMLPKFIVIGVMKGGTSSLYHYLTSDPDIVPSSVKETDFFKTSADFSKGLDWYQKLFTGNGKFAFEASPNYTKRHIFPGVPERMHSIIPEAKLIYALRDPIERIVSHYIHNSAHGRETRSFSQVIKGTNSNYIQTSKYYFQIQAFLEYYSDDQLCLVQSEKLSNNPIKVVNDICEFLEIPFNCDATVFAQRYHESSNKRRASWLERKLTRTTNNRYLIAAVRKIIRPLGKPIKRPVLSTSDKEILLSVISPDIEKLRHYSGCQFPGWSL